MFFNYLEYFIKFYSFTYFFVAGGLYLIFYVVFKKELLHLKIQNKFPETNMIIDEILISIRTIIIFGMVTACYFYFIPKQYQLLYYDISEYGKAYFAISIINSILAHDFIFYCTHRLMHHKKLFFIHKRHHLSTNPTSLAAYSFGPIEAFIQSLTFLFIISIMPIHLYGMLIMHAWNIFFNAMGHLGYDINKNVSDIFKITVMDANYHNLHHSDLKFNGRYGLYFKFWDRVFNTDGKIQKS